MAVTLISTESVRRTHVTGDPSAAGSIPGMASVGDVVINDTTGRTYVVQPGGAAVEASQSLGRAIAVANGWA